MSISHFMIGGGLILLQSRGHTRVRYMEKGPNSMTPVGTDRQSCCDRDRRMAPHYRSSAPMDTDGYLFCTICMTTRPTPGVESMRQDSGYARYPPQGICQYERWISCVSWPIICLLYSYIDRYSVTLLRCLIWSITTLSVG